MDAKIEINNVQELEIILNIILNPNPNTAKIKKTTELVKAYRKKPSSVESFLFIIKNNSSAKLRQLSAILLNKKIESHWDKLDQNFKENTQKLLLELLTQEKEFLVAKAIANLIFRLAKLSLLANEWNSLHNYIFMDPSNFNSSQSHLFELNLYIISELIETCPNQLKPKFLEINNIITLSLTQGSSKVNFISKFT